MTGTRVIGGRYRLIGTHIAEGGMGRIWKAHDDWLRLDVAVKEVLLPSPVSEAERREWLARAEREGRHAAKLRDHPNILAVHDVVVDNGVPYLVMQWVDGVSLGERLKADGPLPVDAAANVARGLLDALGTVHAAGIVHRDVKPSNIMLAGDGQVLLTDFGIAVHEADTILTRDGVIGTLEYVAPERLEGKEERPASDMYSLGVTLFQAVEGYSPFGRESRTATVAAVLMGQIPELRNAGRLAPLINALLATDPDKRPSIAEARALLDEGPPPPPPPPPPPQPPEKKPPAKPPANIGAAFAGIVVIAVLVYIFTIKDKDNGGGDPPANTTPTAAGPSFEAPPVVPTDTTTEEPDDGPFTATIGDCFADSYTTGNQADLHRDACVPGNFEVLERVDGTTDASGECADVPGANRPVYWDATDTRDAMVLCLKYLYVNDIFNATPGDCADGNADGSDWTVVPCDDYVFEILEVIPGTNDHDRCDDSDVRLLFSVAHTEEREFLSAVVCLTFRYSDDRAYGRPENCMLVSDDGSGGAIVEFADCGVATHYVTGFNPDGYDPNWCGMDAAYGWDDDPPWDEYLNFTLCLRSLY